MVFQLVPFAPIHFSMLSGWFTSEADVVRWGGTGVRFPLDTSQLALMLNDGQAEFPERLCWMVQDAAGTFVGHAQLGFDWRNGNAKLARVAIAPAVRGTGLARPVLALVVAEAFSRSGIERVELNVFMSNTPAIKTYEALGFTHEGARRSSARVGAERWDTAGMGLLRAEWRDIAECTDTGDDPERG